MGDLVDLAKHRAQVTAKTPMGETLYGIFEQAHYACAAFAGIDGDGDPNVALFQVSDTLTATQLVTLLGAIEMTKEQVKEMLARCE